MTRTIAMPHEHTPSHELTARWGASIRSAPVRWRTWRSAQASSTSRRDNAIGTIMFNSDGTQAETTCHKIRLVPPTVVEPRSPRRSNDCQTILEPGPVDPELDSDVQLLVELWDSDPRPLACHAHRGRWPLCPGARKTREAATAHRADELASFPGATCWTSTDFGILPTTRRRANTRLGCSSSALSPAATMPRSTFC